MCALDLQVPTLLLGDFNGSVDPTRDYSAGEQRTVCPVLSRLLGPGGPLIDLHRARCPGVETSVIDGSSQMGSGSLPEQNLPTTLVSVAPKGLSPDELARLDQELRKLGD